MSEEVKKEVEQITEELPIINKVELTKEEKLVILKEISTLNQLINTLYYMPKFAKAPKNTSKNNNNLQPEVIGSIPLNYYNNEAMKVWGNRILELTKML